MMKRLILLALAAALPACGGAKNPDTAANQGATENAAAYPGGNGLNTSTSAVTGAPASGQEPGAMETTSGVTDGTNGTGSTSGATSGANGTTTATGGASGTTTTTTKAKKSGGAGSQTTNLESPQGKPAQSGSQQ